MKSLKKVLFSKILIVLLAFIIVFSVSCTIDNSKHTHTESEWVVVTTPTCSTEGLRQVVCTTCDEVIKTEVIEKISHTEVVDTSVSATCTESGLTEGAHCSVCGEILVAQVEVDAFGHQHVLSEELSNGTYSVYICSTCGDTLVESLEECSDGHTETDWIVTKDATCTQTGTRIKMCEVCGQVLTTQTIEKTSHTEVVDASVSPTCTQSGLKEGTHCSVCNEVIVAQVEVDALGHQYTEVTRVDATYEEAGYVDYQCSVCNETYHEVLPMLTYYNPEEETVILLGDVITTENDNGGVEISTNSLKITKGGEYSLSGTLKDGYIVIELPEDEKAVVNLEGVNITSTTDCPIYIIEGDKVEISAKSGTVNYIYDKRTATSTKDASGAAIYSEIDLEIKGKGQLTIEATYNNGLASKDDLEIKNLTLSVTAVNNAVKGNDSLTITSGTITAISTKGDALKTENSDISSKGNQRGTITIEDGTINLYSACDGIDASYDVVINGGTINIFTESFSSYSQEVTVTDNDEMYLRISSRTNLTTAYKYSALFTLQDGTTVWKTASYLSSVGQSRYYKLSSPSGYQYVKFYAYSSSQSVEQSTSYSFVTDQLSKPTNYDTYYINSTSSSNSRMSGSWTNYSTNQSGGGPWGGGMGGEGNSNSSEYSCKGIKADNSVNIFAGTINIKAHDDAVHANNDVLLETSVYGKGDVTITGGTLSLYSDDDGIHADGTLNIENGNIVISNSYEGIEGSYINITGGTTQIKSSDDGVNAITALVISDGFLYLDANGDGLDSNGTITMSGGIVLALGPTNGGNGVLDFDRSFSFTGGLLLAIGCSGMNQRPTASSGNTVTTKTLSTNTSSYLNVTVNNEVVAILKITKSSQNYCVLAYNNTTYPQAAVSVTTSNSYSLVNGLYYTK